MRVALVHYWLVGMRGGEKVLEALCDLYPDADIFTHVYDASTISDKIKAHRVCTTFIQKLPGAIKHYQKYLPLMPLALEELDLSQYDLIISSEAGPAKGIIPRPDALHICYCHSPMRYLWDQYHLYRRSASVGARLLMPVIFHSLRRWDVTSASRVDRFVTNSRFVAQRIDKYYRRASDVIPPPVEVNKFAASNIDKGYYLFVGQLTSYKRADIAIQACRKLGRKLIVVGDGDAKEYLQSIGGSEIAFVGHVDFPTLRKYYAECSALLFPGIEDFGIVPLEAMASGKPVIALAKGGARDSVVHGKTGVLFSNEGVDGLVSAIRQFEASAEDFDGKTIRTHALAFGEENFKSRMKALIQATLDQLT